MNEKTYGKTDEELIARQQQGFELTSMQQRVVAITKQRKQTAGEINALIFYCIAGPIIVAAIWNFI